MLLILVENVLYLYASTFFLFAWQTLILPPHPIVQSLNRSLRNRNSHRGNVSMTVKETLIHVHKIKNLISHAPKIVPHEFSTFVSLSLWNKCPCSPESVSSFQIVPAFRTFYDFQASIYDTVYFTCHYPALQHGECITHSCVKIT